MQHIDLKDAGTNLPDLIESAIQGEEIIITRENKPIVKLVPMIYPNVRPQFGSAQGLISMTDDFDEPIDDFKEYME